MRLLLLLLLRLQRLLVLGQTAADSTGLLGSQIERKVLLVGVEETELVPLVRIDNGHDLGDGFADIVTEN